MSDQPASPWRSMASAPKDGRIVRLLVKFEENSIDDGDEAFPTIGQNNLLNDGADRWQIVGWCWSHDHFTDGEGTPLGWLPMLSSQQIDAQSVNNTVSALSEARRALALTMTANAPSCYKTDADIAKHPTIKKIDSALAALIGGQS